MFGAFPLILIAVVLYNLTVFGGGAAGHDIVSLLAQSFTIPIFSGDKWKISLGDLFVLSALFLLFLETILVRRQAAGERTATRDAGLAA